MIYRFILIFLCLFSTRAFSQDLYFIYIQTDNNQPFTIRLNNSLYSSTSNGYVIVPNISDTVTTCRLIVSFPKDIFSEQRFDVMVNKSDYGFLLSNFSEKGWGLFNLQTMAVIMNTDVSISKQNFEKGGDKKTKNEFAVLLSNAVNDSSVLYTTTAKPKVVTSKTIITNNENTQVTKTIGTTKIDGEEEESRKRQIVKKDKVIKSSTPKIEESISFINIGDLNDTAHSISTKPKSIDSVFVYVPDKPVKEIKQTIIRTNVSKAAEILTDTSYVAVFIDELKDQNDTIRISVPFDETFIVSDAVKIPKSNSNSDSSVINITKNTAPTIIKTELPIANIKKDDSLLQTPAKVDTAVIINKPLADVAVDKTTKEKEIAAVVNATKTELPITPTDTNMTTQKTQGNSNAIKDPNPYVVEKTELFIIKKDTLIAVAKDNTTIDKPVISNVENTVAYKEIKKNVAAIKPDRPVVKADAPTQLVVDSSAVKKRNIVMVNSDCKGLADDGDIDKIRVKMILLETTEEQIKLAKKIYSKKCFTVKQVKALSELFITEEAKYKWFDAIYPFVYDSSNFSSLGDAFKESYYLNRFKAMIRN